MSDDVVATINAILNGEDNFILLLQRPQLERIRDEIVALRDQLDTLTAAYDGLAGSIRPAVAESVRVAQVRIRDEALEEAAQVVEDYFNPETCGPCAAAIRALKDKR